MGLQALEAVSSHCCLGMLNCNLMVSFICIVSVEICCFQQLNRRCVFRRGVFWRGVEEWVCWHWQPRRWPGTKGLFQCVPTSPNQLHASGRRRASGLQSSLEHQRVGREGRKATMGLLSV